VIPFVLLSLPIFGVVALGGALAAQRLDRATMLAATSSAAIALDARQCRLGARHGLARAPVTPDHTLHRRS